jgi:hypothetical protein
MTSEKPKPSEDDVLRRLLNTPPTPFTPKKKRAKTKKARKK